MVEAGRHEAQEELMFQFESEGREKTDIPAQTGRRISCSLGGGPVFLVNSALRLGRATGRAIPPIPMLASSRNSHRHTQNPV